ncbi:MAG: hypothetical protein FJ271_18285 [Planctomycetes bacterium]|nr:hypothetical protein [Planctomycetota bacterium]
MGIELSTDSAQVLVAFAAYLVGVALLGYFSHRYLTRGAFVNEYFLGNRGLGPWVLALTVAATAISGGTFMGFPSLIYTNGWIMALWIASYMVGPLTGMTLMGKRLNQVSRICGSVTVPDVLRDRFNSPTLGITASLLILACLMVNLVGQFKAGGTVMREALRLPPLRADVAATEVDDKNKELVVTFRQDDGTELTQRTALPAATAVLLPNKTEIRETDNGPDHLLFHFQIDKTEAVKRVAFPPQQLRLPFSGQALDKGYLLGLIIFAITVIGYTTYGGFWAVTLTDVLEGLVMLAGVITMAVLAVRAVPAIEVERSVPDRGAGQAATRKVELHGLAAATEHLRRQDPQLVYGPGPGDYLPLGMAFSFFLMWSLMSPGQPSGMVRLMSFKDSASARRATMLMCFYFAITYLCLLAIFICARAIFPRDYLHEAGSEARGEPDQIMPAMARHLAHPLVAGLLLAAPYAAIMSTVAAFLLMISSSLVRDLYQRVINPNVSERTLKISSYVITALVGVGVMIGALNPPRFLQYVIVFTGSAMGCAFLVPMLLTLYWKRATRSGILAGMLGGFFAVVSLYVLGWTDSRCQRALKEYEQATAVAAARGEAPPPAPVTARWLDDTLGWIPGWGQERHDPFNPIFAAGVDTLVWGMLASLILGVGVSMLGRPDAEQVRRFFPELES